jgi:hypothetical protein|tara:strand:+ start:1078 stop:1374 length:297 start_codon:yes stop_codon:yes gene_type:complete
MTEKERTSALACLNELIPSRQTLGPGGKYNQVLRFTARGYTIRMDEYWCSGGAGFIRVLEAPDASVRGLTNIYKEHSGPEVHRDRKNGWSEAKEPDFV